MTTTSSKPCHGTRVSTRRAFRRRHPGLMSWCVVPSFCMLMALSQAMAGTNGASSIDTRAGKSASVHIGARDGDVQARFAFFGSSFAEWTQRFWSWSMSIPVNVGPATDKTGINCGINQSGPVWFLAAPLGGTNTISCAIPAGKVILAPAVTYLNDYPCPDPTFEPPSGQTLEDFLTQGATAYIDNFTASVELDGKALPVYRVTAGLQSFTAAKDLSSIDACVTGSPQLGVADGEYVLIGRLSPGSHVLHIHVDSPFGSSDTTFHLTIK